MANTVENTFDKIGNTLETLFGTASGAKQLETNKGVGKASSLEMYGMQARQYHLNKNEWRKDLQYTRALVNAEYNIQTEFKINGGSKPPTEQQTTSKIDKFDNKIKKLEEKKQKLQNEQIKRKEKLS